MFGNNGDVSEGPDLVWEARGGAPEEEKFQAILEDG
jgi:hypothetical protein